MRPARYGKGGLTRYAAMMADKLKTPGLSAAEQARIQRAVDQGFTNIAYHSTHEPWDEIDLNYTDVGLHAGTPTQAANRALDKAIQAKLQKHRSEGKYIPHTNVMPFAYRPGKSLRVTDVGEFKDAMTTLLGLRSNPALKGQAWIDDLLDYVEPEKMSYTPEGQEADWLTDTANLMALADIRQNLRGMGYDTVVYPNQIENAYQAQTELLPEAEARLAAMKQAADALYQKGKSLSPAVPDLNATEEDIAKFLAAGDPLDYLSPDERALYEKYRDESYGIRQDPANYDNPNSVIFLDPSGVRSVNAQFAPEAIGETGLFKRDGGPVAFGRGGVNQIAERAAAAARAAGKAADAVEQAPTEGLSAASMIPMAESVIKLGKKGVSTARKAVDELREIFQENPLNPRELVTNGAAATVYPMGNTLRLSDIRTFAAGQGNASQALRSVLEVADRNKVPVTLTAKNYSGEGLTTAQLVDWYKRNGFEITRDLGDDGVDMIRQPRGVAEEIPGTSRQMLNEVAPKPVEDFFQKKIAGEVPDWKARYRTINMPIDDFLALAKEGTDADKAKTVSDLIESGTKFETIPYLNIRIDGDVASVVGHEGRHRARALKGQGYTHMPVVLSTDNLRWSEQGDPSLFDYEKTWPKTLVSEEGKTQIPFPVSRENAMAPYVSAANAAETVPSTSRQMLEEVAPAARQIDTPEFKNWFGQSVITRSLEPRGEPRRLYHITPKDFPAFNVNQADATDPLGAKSGPVIFMTDDAENQMAAHNVGGYNDKYKEGSNVMPLYANMKNPLFVDEKSKGAERTRLGLSRGWPTLYTQDDVAKLKDAGYDGVYVVNEDIPNEIVAFRPEQVKSAIGNEGTFDPTNPVITKAEGGLVFDQDRINALADQLGAPRMADGGEVSMRDGGEYDSAGAFAQLEAAERAARLRGATPLERYTYESLGMEPGLDRATFLPIAGRGADRQLAVPGLIYDIGKALMTPGAAASGVPLSYEDVSNLAGNVMGGGYATSAPIDGAVAGMAVKQKGGNWLADTVEDSLRQLRRRGVNNADPAEVLLRLEEKYGPEGAAEVLASGMYPNIKEDAAINRWIDTKLARYIKNEMATPEDPVRIQADQWAVEQQRLLANKDAQIAKATADMEKARAERGFTPEMMTRSQAQIRDLQRERALIANRTGLHVDPEQLTFRPEAQEHWPIKGQQLLAQSPVAKVWEGQADTVMGINTAGYEWWPQTIERNPWLLKVPPETPVHAVSSSSVYDLGIDHMVDELRNALNPASGLPERLLIDRAKLEKMTVPQIVKHVDEINAWRSVQTAEANAARAANAATAPFRTYETIPSTDQPNQRGLRWVELRLPDYDDLPIEERTQIIARLRKEAEEKGFNPDNYIEKHFQNQLKDALKYEGEMLQHCVGGYCPDVAEGRSRIYSLRDAEGKPHVTIEVQPNPQPYPVSGEAWARLTDAEHAQYSEYVRQWRRRNPYVEELEGEDIEEALREAGVPPQPDTIIQIKGLKNRAPNAEYLPFVQDFVRSGRWSRVGDLKNTGLYRADPNELGMFVPQNPALQELPGRRADYLRRAQQAGLFGDRQYLTREEWEGILRQQIESESGRLPNQGYAEGGLVGLHAKYEDGGVVKMNVPKEITLADLLRRYAPEAVVDVMDELGQLRGAYNAGLETQIAPDEGGLPGLALQTASLPELPGALVTLAGAGVAAIDPETGLGIIDAGDKYAAMLPEDIADYSARYDAHLDRMLEKYGLPATGSLDPMDRFALAAGEMTGQLPMPAAWLNKLKAAKRIPKVIPLLAEYFGPVVDPKAANYAVGTTVGGALRQLEEPAPEKATLTYSPPAFPKMAEGGAFDADRINAMADQLMGKPQAFARGGIGRTADRAAEGAERAALTAAERAEAGRKAAQRIKMQEELKASEALGRARELGIQRVHATQSDRTRVGGGNIGGPAFSALSRVHPSYWDYVWGVGKPQTAQRLINLSQPGSAWTTLLGGADQLKSNPIVFDKLKRGFLSSMKAGALSDELADKINKNLALTFGEGVDIRDPSIWDLANTYDARAALADVMMGKGINPKKGGVALGGEKSGQGVIFRPSDILRRETEPGLLHAEHGGNVPTFAVGPRLFTLRNEIDVRPDLHPGYPVLIRGQDLDVKYAPVPIEIFMPDWHKKFADVVGSRKPGYYDYTMGLINEGLPSQEITDAYLKYLMSEGFAGGGSVSYLQHLARI